MKTPMFATLALLLVACSSSSTGSSTGSSSGSDGGASDAGGCGLAFYSKDYDGVCQTSLDAACCTQEKACGASGDCVKLIACINACPSPRQDACVNACSASGTSTPGFAELDAIATCTKSPSYAGPASCAWPSGNGH